MLWLAAAFIAVSGLLVASTLWVLRSQAIENGSELTAASANAIEEQTARTLQSVDQCLQLASVGMAQLSATGALNLVSGNALMREQIKELPFIRALWVMNSQGRILYDSDTAAVGLELGDRDYFKIYESEPHTVFNIGVPVRSRSSGKWIITASRPLRAPDGSFGGIIVAAVSPVWFDKVWSTSSLGAGSSTALIRRDGVLMMRSPFDETLLGQKFTNLPQFDQIKAGEDTGGFDQISPFDGVHRQYAYRAMATHRDLILVVGQPREIVMAQWRRLALALGTLWAIATAIVAVLSFYLDRGMALRLRSEQALREHDQFLRTLVDAIPGMLGYWTTNLRCGFANPPYREWFGKTPAEMEGITMQALLGDAVFERNAPYARAALAGDFQQFERTLTKSDGTMGHTLAQYVPHRQGSEVIGFLAVITDVTDLKKNALALTQSNHDLARSNADLQQFAYAASHDLQEPLRSVASCVQLLKKRYGGHIDARADEFINHAVGAASRMQSMIDDLLHLSRLSTGPMQRDAVDSKLAVDTACDNLKKARDEAQATVTMGSLPVVGANLSQLTQLFQNLIGNALKFRGDKPAVVHIDARAEGHEWVFSVADQGIGMEPQYFVRIFQLFQRLHTRDDYAGTGIGLTLCQKIVHRHGGRIWLESTPGAGTTFFFTLPQQVGW
jgi:PAS domain S-box-containing protein